MEVGYGNAAGLLFRKGISGPPAAHIEEMAEQPDQTASSSTSANAAERHPITSLRAGDNDDSTQLGEMTDEEKEREAERLFVLFDRMERNSMISASSGNEEPKGIREIMRDKMVNGEGDAWEDEERKRIDTEEGQDEEEVQKEMKAYKRRNGRT